ncbi:GyrI-like domain-containing protein [Anaeromicropila herbilytica]|uniref:AraC family transcriptional regulator n=1 Tax=Anaeromicropila herbilytica TaxID=2785025 RepID=A0A7R7EK61_9FIRM|nr:GyrI-like domain-containing protein [Anaeromicropila herbilytica]BCN30625.1 AraC family transcriptional regulator [Anaeromicropila herbilytica]
MGVNMNYDIVKLEQKLVAGLRIRTSNGNPDTPKDIASLWEKFFRDGVYQSIEHKVNDSTIGLYTNYENDVAGEYDMLVCCEIDDKNNQNTNTELEYEIISAGTYAKFIVIGDVKNAVSDFWMKLWNMNLNRKYTSDFEEYHMDEEGNCNEIHIYIALQ